MKYIRLKISAPKGPLKIGTIFSLPTTVGRHCHILNRQVPKSDPNKETASAYLKSFPKFSHHNDKTVMKRFQISKWMENRQTFPSHMLRCAKPRSVHWLMFVKGRFPKFWMSRWSRYVFFSSYQSKTWE